MATTGIYVVECRAGNYLIEKSASIHNINLHPIRQTASDRGIVIDYIIINDALTTPCGDNIITHVDVIIETRNNVVHFDNIEVKLNGPVVNCNYRPAALKPQSVAATGMITGVRVEYKLNGVSNVSNNYRFFLREDDIIETATSSCNIM